MSRQGRQPNMKSRFLILIFFLIAIATPARCGTFACEWNFVDFIGEAQTTNKVYITPIAPYGVNASTTLITGDRRAYTNSTSSLIVSNMFNGRSYRIEFVGRYVTTVITNSFDTNVTGLVNGADPQYLTAPVRDTSTVAFSQAAADARFHNVSGDTSTNAAFRGTLKIPAGATVGYVFTVTNADGSGAWLPTTGTTYTNNTGNAGQVVGSGIGTNPPPQVVTNGDTRALSFSTSVAAPAFSGGSASISAISAVTVTASGGISGPGTGLTAIPGSAIASGIVADTYIASTIARDAEVVAMLGNGTNNIASTNFVGNGGNLTNVTADFAGDPDAMAYMRATGLTNSPFRDRLNSAFLVAKEIGWTNVIDVFALGTNFNQAGDYWRTFKLLYGTNFNNPTVMAEGILFTGGTNRAQIRGLPDMRSNTLIVSVDMMGGASNVIVVAQRSTSSDGSMGLIAQPYIGSPVYTAAPIQAYYADNISAGRAMSNSVPHWSTVGGLTGLSASEHYIAFGVDGNLRRTILVDGYSNGTITNTTFTISNAITTLNIAAFLNGDSDNITTGCFVGRVRGAAILKGMATTNNIWKAMTLLRWLDTRKGNHLFAGDSLTAEYDYGYNYDSAYGNTNNWPWQFENQPANKHFYRNFARGGMFSQDANGAWFTNGPMAFMPTPGGPVEYAVWYDRFGANELLSSRNMTNAFTDDSKPRWALATSKGFQVNVLDMTPITNSSIGPTANMLTNDFYRTDFNEMLAGAEGYYFSKLWKVSQLQTNTVDGTHPTYAQNQRIAQFIQNGGSVPFAWSIFKSGSFSFWDTANNYINLSFANGQLVGTNGFDVDAQTYFTRAGITNQAERLDYNTFILGLKTLNAYTNLDCLYFFPQEANYGYNAISSSYDITWTGSPTHSAGDGADFDGSNDYGDTGYNPNSGTKKFVQDSACMVMYSATASISDGNYLMGCSPDGSNHRASFSRNGTSANLGGLNNNVAAVTIAASSDWSGLWIANRTSSTAESLALRSVTPVTDSTASTGVPNGNLYIGARNDSGSPGNYTACEIKLVIIGSGLDATKLAGIKTLIAALKTSRGW